MNGFVFLAPFLFSLLACASSDKVTTSTADSLSEGVVSPQATTGSDALTDAVLLENTAGDMAVPSHSSMANSSFAARPRFAFTLTSFVAGDLDRGCKDAALRAKSLGFQAVSLIPARIFNGQLVSSQGLAPKEEVARCLEVLWQADFNIVYQPHLESDYINHPEVPGVWRAEFKVLPNEVYQREMFDGIMSWLPMHRDEIAAGKRQVDLVIAGELETSTTKYSAQWTNLVSRLRTALKSMGLEGKVAIGYNPNWWPKPAFEDNGKACEQFREFVRAVDFIAPSFYGDWSQMFGGDGVTPRGRGQVDDLKKAMLARLSYYSVIQCKVPEMAAKPFVIGEFAVGGDPAHAEQENWQKMTNPNFVSQRRAIYSNLIDWARGQNSSLQKALRLALMTQDFDGRRPAAESFGDKKPKKKPGKTPEPPRLLLATWAPTINIWTLGAFDPVGIMSGGTKIPDAEIARQLIGYATEYAVPFP